VAARVTGVVGALMVACCVAGPAVIGAVAGASLGGALGLVAAVAVAAVVGLVVYRLTRSRGGC
jgi:hypothetical protein